MSRVRRFAEHHERERVSECPNCDELINESCSFCPHCGVDIFYAVAEKMEAEGKGLTVQQLRALKKMEAENEELRRLMQERKEREEQAKKEKIRLIQQKKEQEQRQLLDIERAKEEKEERKQLKKEKVKKRIKRSVSIALSGIFIAAVLIITNFGFFRGIFNTLFPQKTKQHTLGEMTYTMSVDFELEESLRYNIPVYNFFGGDVKNEIGIVYDFQCVEFRSFFQMDDETANKFDDEFHIESVFNSTVEDIINNEMYAGGMEYNNIDFNGVKALEFTYFGNANNNMTCINGILFLLNGNVYSLQQTVIPVNKSIYVVDLGKYRTEFDLILASFKLKGA